MPLAARSEPAMSLQPSPASENRYGAPFNFLFDGASSVSEIVLKSVSSIHIASESSPLVLATSSSFSADLYEPLEPRIKRRVKHSLCPIPAPLQGHKKKGGVKPVQTNAPSIPCVKGEKLRSLKVGREAPCISSEPRSLE